MKGKLLDVWEQTGNVFVNKTRLYRGLMEGEWQGASDKGAGGEKEGGHEKGSGSACDV